MQYHVKLLKPQYWYYNAIIALFPVNYDYLSGRMFLPGQYKQLQ